jgi:hypothetical protein
MQPTTVTASPLPSILHDLTIDHGPAGLLAPLILRAENAVRAMGVTLGFGSLHDLARVNAANRDSWLPLFPIYQPAYWPDDNGEAYCLLGREASGRVVYTLAARIYDWPATTFHDEATSLRLFYGDVPRYRGLAERCVVSAQATRRIGGRVAVGGAIWVHPDWRGRKSLVTLGGQIGRAYCIARWNIDFYTAMMTGTNFKKGLGDKCRVGNTDWSIDMHGCPLGDLSLAFFWWNRAELHDDLASMLVDLSTEVDVGVGLHDAEKNLRT